MIRGFDELRESISGRVSNTLFRACLRMGSICFEEREMDSFEFYEKMMEIKEKCKGDPELCHIRMDELMCELLIDLGYESGVDVFNSIERWYP